MTLHQALTAAYQIPCCFSAALLIMFTARAAFYEFLDWFSGVES